MDGTFASLPKETTLAPHQYIAVSGLNVTNNERHKAIWDCFVTNRRPDRLTLHFQQIGVENEFPKAKPKRTSFDTYMPRGIVKTNWLPKHLYQVPAVVVLFVDLDWDHPSWPEKQQECASKVDSIRHSLEGRSTRVAVVLIQKSPSLSAGEDDRASQRATELCSACDLSPKALFVLPQTDQLFGFILRLEHAFYELAQGYYQNELKRIKTKKDALHKEKYNHQVLILRYNFKLAYFNEIKQDTQAALKSYKQAYSQLLEIAYPVHNCVEFKTVAGILSYKVCKLSFSHNTPLDAIGQFKKHVEFYKTHGGLAELRFEHYAWLCDQYTIFAGLFDQAIQNGLAAIQTQHPGFYYQSGSSLAGFRRGEAQNFQADLPPYPEPDPLANRDNLQYYGQRPWRVRATSDALDESLEAAGIVALQHEEMKVDHSKIVLQLLSSSMQHFKRHKCPRMRRMAMVHLADEYMRMLDFGKALQLYSHTIWEYRTEQWLLPLREILIRALKCSFVLGNVKDYVTTSFELLGPNMKTSNEARERIQSNLSLIFTGAPPNPEPQLDSTVVETAKAVWTKEFAERCFLMIQMQNIASCIEAKATFKRSKVRSDRPVTVLAYLRSSAPREIQFSKLAIRFSNEVYDEHCISTSVPDLLLQPNKVAFFKFKFVPRAEDVGSKLEISSLSLDLGQVNAPVYCTLHWEGGGGEAIGTSYPPEYLICNRFPDPMDRIMLQPTLTIARVHPRFPEMEIKLNHQPPMLLGENYIVEICMRNTEDRDVTSLQVKACLVQDSMTETPGSVLLKFEDTSDYGASADSEIGSLKKDEKISRNLIIAAHQLGMKFIKVEVVYNVVAMVEGDRAVCKCIWTHCLELPTAQPFRLETTFMSQRLEVVEQLVRAEDAIVSTQLQNSSSLDVVIDGVLWETEPIFNVDTSFMSANLKNVPLHKEEHATVVATMQPTGSTGSAPKSLGVLSVIWKRSEKDDLVTTVLPLPSVSVIDCPVIATCILPAYGSVRHPATIDYRLTNVSDSEQSLEVTMDSATESFMFSGERLVG